MTGSPQKLFDFIEQHKTKMAKYISRSSNTPPRRSTYSNNQKFHQAGGLKTSKSNQTLPLSAEELAFMSVKESAAGGYVPAQDLLAYCYATGTGTKANEYLAFCWYLRAAIAGSKSALNSLLACFNGNIGVKASPQLCRLLKEVLE